MNDNTETAKVQPRARTVHRKAQQRNFARSMARQFDTLLKLLEDAGPLTFVGEIADLRKLGYRIADKAMKQKQVGV